MTATTAASVVCSVNLAHESDARKEEQGMRWTRAVLPLHPLHRLLSCHRTLSPRILSVSLLCRIDSQRKGKDGRVYDVLKS